MSERTCAREWCDEPLPERARRNRCYCDDAGCRARAQWEAKKADPERLARNNEKQRLLMAAKFASMTPVERAAWSIRRRERDGAERAREIGAPVEEFDMLRDVIIPQGIHCFICGGRTALVLGGRGKPSPVAISVDHVVPFEHGGGHTVDNCRVVHHGCNARKQDRSLEWAREHSERRDAPAPTVAQLHAFMGALVLTSGGAGVLLANDNETEIE